MSEDGNAYTVQATGSTMGLAYADLKAPVVAEAKIDRATNILEGPMDKNASGNLGSQKLEDTVDL